MLNFWGVCFELLILFVQPSAKAVKGRLSSQIWNPEKNKTPASNNHHTPEN